MTVPEPATSGALLAPVRAQPGPDQRRADTVAGIEMSVNRVACVVFDTSTLVGAMLQIGSVPHRALGQALAATQICVSTAMCA